MRKIDDRILLGTLSGVIGTVVAFVVNYPLFRMGWAVKTWPMRATGLTVSRKFYRIRSSRFLGLVTMLGLGGLCGVGQAYMYSISGKDRRYIKAIDYGVLTWMGLHGIGSRVSNSFGESDSPPKTAAVSLGINILNAVITSELIDRLGDERLFKSSASKPIPFTAISTASHGMPAHLDEDMQTVPLALSPEQGRTKEIGNDSRR